MAKPSQLVMLAAIALLVWLVYFREPQHELQQSTPRPATLPPGGAAAAPAPSKPKRSAPKVDVAGGIPDGGQYVLLRNSPNVVGTVGGWMQDFYDQIWLPASRVRLSTLAQEDWIYAMQFLQNGGGEFFRRDDLGEVGQAILQGVGDRAGAEVWTQIVSNVASIVPVVGPLIAKVNAVQTGELQAGDAWDQAMGGGAIGGLMRDTLSQDTPQTRHLLANYSDANSYHGASFSPSEWDPTFYVAPDGPDAPLNRRVMTLPPEVWLMPMQNFSPPAIAFTAKDATGAPVSFRVRQRLFTRYEGGWILPWLCWHFNGDPTQHVGLRQTVNAVALVYRTVDALIAGSQPWTREGARYFCEWTREQQNAGVEIGNPHNPPPRFPQAGIYFYDNPFVGPMLGTIFPPQAGDRRYVGSDGRRYSFYGEPQTGLPPGAVGPMDDSAIDPVVRAAAAARAQVSVLTAPPPDPPRANAVLTPPRPPAAAGTMVLSLGSLGALQLGAMTGGSSM